LSISTSPPETRPTSLGEFPLRRPPRRRLRFGRRGLAAVGTVLLVLLVGVGAFLAYENTLPTTVATNIKDGQMDVPTDGSFVLNFSRSVSLDVVKAAFSITPSTEGDLYAVSGQTEFAWTPAKPLNELTTYTVTLLPIVDVGKHHVNGGHWSFTTIIVPRVVAIAAGDGTALKDGMEIDPGATLRLTFNDAMVADTIKATVSGQLAALKWATDYRSATFSTAGLPSGPLSVQIAPGGRDQSGHVIAAAFTLKTGIYWHDHEHTVSLRYPALIQIPNDSNAVDQNGLQAADIIFEYLAEGGITRLTGVFENAPDLIGPMRSARFISLKLGRHYRGLLFQSGESAATRARAASDPTPQFFDTIGYQYRTNARYAPDNLMINGDRVRAAEALYGLAAYTIPKARPDLSGGSGASTVTVDEHYSKYTYDPATGTYLKNEAGHNYKDASLKQPLRIEMLIVLHTQEQLLNVGDGHGAHIHDFDLDTSGAINVYYKGLGYKGTWKSVDSHGPLVFTLEGGQNLTLPPGLIWIDVTQ
jgi:Protein of unknown function (DUF3048) N-terminal domain/Protein of unknown function (DUF3048) C-terminal domain/Bacterial Ig-like domain